MIHSQLKKLSILLLYSFFISASLFSKPVFVVPGDNPIYRHYTSNIPLSTWDLVDLELRRKGSMLKLSDFSEFLYPFDLKKNLSGLEKILFCEIPLTWLSNWEEKIAIIPIQKKILVMFEPPSVLPLMYTSRTYALFDKILTWDDSLVDNKKFFKFCYPVIKPFPHKVVPFSEKKMFTQVSANKTSQHPDELYSERLKIITYFEENNDSDLEFYGHGWEGLNLKSYHGSVSDKIETIRKYRFCFCYENLKNVKGYITEKIFDCFAAGIVPIYLGASNISQYIPKNCFIAREDFSSLNELVTTLKNMKELEYNKYLANIEAFLDSKEAKQFSQERFVEIFSDLVLSDKYYDLSNLNKNT